MIFDVAVFGGGVVGCSLFSKLTRIGKKVALIEKNNDVATGCSKANSGLVHAGFDCATNTLKAKLNVRGNFLFDKLTKELSVPYIKTGAVVVGNSIERLNELLMRGKTNNVKNLKIINSEELHSLVPNLSKDINFALYAKDAGIVSPYLFTIALAEESVINGGKVYFNYTATNIVKQNDVFSISNDKTTIKAKIIINCAGFGYNEIAKLLNSEQKELMFKRGEYFVLDKNTNFVKLTVFPLPTNAGKGILATPTVSGNVMFGPTSEISDNSTKTTLNGLNNIKENINAMFDNVPWNKVIREYSGVRVSCGDDFVIEKSRIENVINICGINSPGLSSAPAIAEYVCELLNFDLTEKPFLKRTPYTKTSNMPIEKLNVLIKNCPSYGKIVCRCENITEGEILEALNSPLKPSSCDAIKRRVRAGMGRCQGGFCSLKVCEIISKTRKIPIEKIEKDCTNSFVMLGDIKPNKFGDYNG